MHENELFNKRVESIELLLKDTYRSLDKIHALLESLGKEVKREEYKSIEGLVGTFDGNYLVDQAGNKHEIPSNYAAKSRLVYGDTVKMIEDNGQTVFKQIQKVERKRTEGVLSKKEGKWYILTDSGSYKISDVGADFNQAELNDEAVAFIPAQNLNAPFATLDRVLKKEPALNTKAPAPTTHHPVNEVKASTIPVSKPSIEHNKPFVEHKGPPQSTQSKVSVPKSGGKPRSASPKLTKPAGIPQKKEPVPEEKITVADAPIAKVQVEDDDLR